MKFLILLVGFMLFAFGMAKVKGLDIYLMVNTGTEESKSWTKVGGQKDATFDRGSGTIDVTDKDSGGDEEHLPGFRNWGVSFDAFLIETNNAGWIKIETARDEGAQLLYQIITPAFVYEGKASVESIGMSGPLADAGVVALSLKGTGPLSKTAR